MKRKQCNGFDNLVIGFNDDLVINGNRNRVIGHNSGKSIVDDSDWLIIGDNLLNGWDSDETPAITINKTVIGRTLFGEPLDLPHLILNFVHLNIFDND